MSEPLNGNNRNWLLSVSDFAYGYSYNADLNDTMVVLIMMVTIMLLIT